LSMKRIMFGQLLMVGLVGCCFDASSAEVGAPDEAVGWCIQAVADASNALQRTEAALGKDDAGLIDALLAYADTCATAREDERAEALYRRAIDLHSDAFRNLAGEDFGPRLVKRMKMLTGLGDLLFRESRFAEAEKVYKRSVDVARLGVSSNSDEVRVARTGLAMAVARRWPRENVPRLLEDLLASCKKVFGDEHIQVARVLEASMVFRVDMGEPDAALPLAESLVAMQRKVLRADHPALAESLNHLASLYFEKGRQADALPLLEEALGIRRRAFGRTHDLTERSMQNLAEAYQALGQKEKAVAPLNP